MKTKEIVLYSVLFVLASLYSVNVVTGSMLHTTFSLNTLKIFATKQYGQLPAAVATGQCSTQPALNLTGSTDPQLTKLSEYQVVCESFVAGELMVFTDMPKDDLDAKARATAFAETLKAFRQVGVKPLVMVEPVTDWGLIDFKEFDSGFYDQWLSTYFTTLKSQGITDADMGTWGPFPEANLPYWNNLSATPRDFANVVNRYLRIMQETFPKAKGTVLLNSATYETTDFEWQNGEYISLRDYVVGLDKKLVTSFGLQGFPWMPDASQVGPGIFDAGEYLNYHLASEAADILGTKEIWFNTGSFQSKYTLDIEKTVYLSPAKRTDMLNGILDEALKLRDHGYQIRINLFSEDKSRVAEATNWSYWETGRELQSEHMPVFTTFARRLAQEQIKLSIFDKDNSRLEKPAR